MELLAGKIVCITGSSRGIGRACAIESAKHGATGLVLHYLGDHETEAEILLLKQEIEVAYTHSRVVGIPGDIADPETAHQVGTSAITMSPHSSLRGSTTDSQDRCRSLRTNWCVLNL